MKFNRLVIAAIAVLTAAHSAAAATVIIEALDVRGTGIFGHDDNVSNATYNGGDFPGGSGNAVDPIDVALTYSNLDLDGDSTANDAVTFTLRFTKFGSDGGALRSFGQGMDTGFGNLNDVEVSMLSVSGTTTDNGVPILFDGFTGGAAGAGASAAVDRSVEINGTGVVLTTPGAGGFEFAVEAVDFAPTPLVTFDNSGGSLGSVVARHYDLQFSAIPEPTSIVLLGLGALGFATRRR